MEHLRIELFASSLRECHVYEAACGTTGPANILMESCERSGLLEQEYEAFGEEVHANRDGGCCDNYLWGTIDALHAFRHSHDIICGRLAIEYENAIIYDCSALRRSDALLLRIDLRCRSLINKWH